MLSLASSSINFHFNPLYSQLAGIGDFNASKGNGKYFFFAFPRIWVKLYIYMCFVLKNLSEDSWVFRKPLFLHFCFILLSSVLLRFLVSLASKPAFFFFLFSVPSIILRIYIIFSFFDRARTSMTCMCVFLFFRLYGAYEVRKLEAELSDLRRVFHCCKSAVVRQWGHHLAPELTPTSAQRIRFSSYCCSHDHYGSEGVIIVFFCWFECGVRSSLLRRQLL